MARHRGIVALGGSAARIGARHLSGGLIVGGGALGVALGWRNGSASRRSLGIA